MDFNKLCTEFLENKRLLEELQAMQEDLKAQILAIMGDATEYTSDVFKACNKPVTSTRIDSTSLKKALPDVYLDYSITSTYNRFTIS